MRKLIFIFFFLICSSAQATTFINVPANVQRSLSRYTVPLPPQINFEYGSCPTTPFLSSCTTYTPGTKVFDHIYLVPYQFALDDLHHEVGHLFDMAYMNARSRALFFAMDHRTPTKWYIRHTDVPVVSESERFADIYRFCSYQDNNVMVSHYKSQDDFNVNISHAALPRFRAFMRAVAAGVYGPPDYQSFSS